VTLEWILLALRVLAVAVLYAFLVVLIYVIWQDLRKAAPAPSERQTASLPAEGSNASGGRLRIVASGEASLRPGEFVPLQVPTTLGRAPDNHVVLADAYVSSYHARLDQRGGEWWLTDMGSRNGTRLNDVPITKSAPLADGDVIGVGQVELMLEIED
jgi:pSer/pThr/pTyr-binding forkhead associated (FHA) protein